VNLCTGSTALFSDKLTTLTVATTRVPMTACGFWWKPSVLSADVRTWGVHFGLARVFVRQTTGFVLRNVFCAALEEFSIVVGTIRRATEEVIADEQSREASHEDFDAEAASVAIGYLRVLLESSDGEAAEASLVVEKVLAGRVDNHIWMPSSRQSVS
jgi:hypothetical protein